jgi:hypothetical protein
MKILLPTVVLSLLATSSGLAQSPLFLRDGPIRHFNDDDMALFKETLDSALADNTEQHWQNDETQSGGSVTPLNTEDKNGMTCRLTRIINTAKEITRESEFTLCKADDGRWLFAE